MALSNDLATLFAKTTQDKQESKKESTAYGKIVVDDGKEYVQLDGSDLLTPISSTTVVQDGDRVLVTIKNHTAIVTGDLTTPSASNKDVEKIGTKISEFDIVIADKVSTEQLEAEMARIEQLRVTDLTATNAKFETIEGKVAEIDTIKADVIEVSGKVTAHEGEFTTLRADIADFKDVTAESIEAIEGEFHTLESDYATFEETVTNKLTANEATIKDLQTNKLDTTTANITYANIDFSNIKEAAIEKLFSDSGIIKDLIMSDGKVTGELVGVTIKGDLIEGNTVKADKLVIQGEDGLYYKLNVNALGETTASSDEKYQNGLDGSVIVAESITAEKISVDDLVAFGATIGGFHIDGNALYSGVKSTIDNTTDGIFLGDDGQVNIGNSNNYLKFYKDQNGAYKLEIQASSIKFGASGTTIEEAINNVSDKVDDIQIGGRNLYLSTKQPYDNYDIWYNIDLWDRSDTSENGLFPVYQTGVIEGIYQPIEVRAGEVYTFSGYVLAYTPETIVRVYVEDSNDDSAKATNNGITINIPSEMNWTRFYSTHVVTSDGILKARIQNDSDTEEAGIEVYGLKLEKGNKATDWSPAPEDTISEIDDAKNEAINTAADDATTKANTAETNATNAANEYTDSQITIVNKTITDEVAEINITTNSISQKVTSVETTVSTKANASDVYNKTEVDTKIDDIEIGGRNLFIKNNLTTHNVDSYEWNNYTLSCVCSKGSAGLKFVSSLFTVGKTYVLSFKFKKVDGTLTKIGGHAGGFSQQLFSVDGEVVSPGYTYPVGYPLDDTTDTHEVYVILKYNGNAEDNQLYIQVNRMDTSTAASFDIWDIKLEEGNKPTDWSPAPEDVDTNIDNITTETNAKINSLEIKTDGIVSEVSNIKTIQTTTTDAIGTINTDISTLTETVNTKMDSNSVDIAITSALQNGVNKVSTTTGFTFDEEGLTISKTGKEMVTIIDEDGMEIKRGEDTQLLANNEGVIAYDLHAKTYLIVGENSRFEDYTKNGKKQTGCFWIGDTEVSS